MRPAGRGPLESLYFHYPHFSARPVPELDGQTITHPVAIVGGGPVGMTAALALARYGIRSVLLDRKPTFNDGSRATCIARASYHIFEQIGAVAPFLAKSLGWRRGRSFFRGREIYRFDMPHSDDEKYLPMYNLQQQYLEQYLWDAVARSPLIDARWESEVSAIAEQPDGVRLRIETPLGAYPLTAQYVLAADGARSAVRGLLGLRLQGENYEGRYVIADVRMEHDYPTERRALFDPASNPGGTVLIHKQPDNIWRVDYQLRDGESAEAAVEEANIRARVGAILKDIGHDKPWELEWWSIYTANTLCLDDYTHGRTIFIGDSAHIVPIFGVRGLNNGLADAFNIGWKLGYVLGGQAGAGLLDSYTPERRGATLDVFANASKSARFMTPPTRGVALMRAAVLSLALRHDFVRRFVDPRLMVPYTYRETLGETARRRDSEFSGGAVAGSACVNAHLADGSYLLDHVGTGFAGLYFSDGAPLDPALAARLGALDPRFTLVTIAAPGAAAPAGAIADPHGTVSRRLAAGPGSFYLLRPDMHVAGRWRRLEATEVTDVLALALGRSQGRTG
ncbi:MAG: FAD-dependent monooxygenase [Rhodospirillales bacterium]|nr:FAD-dependent monooxygenase [Rhodospirillales bacterium]